MENKEKENKPDLAATVLTDLTYLRQISKPTNLKEIEKRQVVPLIKYALFRAWTFGYGLAAIQVGIPIAAAWYWLPSDKDRGPSGLGEGHLLINPQILEMSEPIIKPGEGCLSMPGKMFTTKRYNRIVLLNDGHKGIAEGVEAQIIQHETDHINGILVPDREYKSSTVGRNDACPCGSGKKYKKCCLEKGAL